MPLSSKIQRPDNPPGIIDRSRLYQKLDDWRAVRAVFVQAPTGYGKSTLTSRWIENAGLGDRAAWLSLAEEDSEPRRFVQYVAAALDRCLPGIAGVIEPALKDRRSSAQRALNRLLAILEEEFLPLKEQTDNHILLVLDDVQRVHSAEVDRLLLQILEFGPQRLHLVLLTRQHTDIPLARLYAQGKILALDKEDLRFTEEEVAAYLREHGFAPLGLLAEDVARLTERSEGWVAALQLAVLSLAKPGSAAELQRALQGDQQWLARYLVDEVLARQDVERRQFLLLTSILDRFNAALCTAVTGMADAALQLAGIAHADLFLVRLNREEGWFRYHHLFQELLQKRLNETLGAGDVALLHRRAGRWLADHGDIETALAHLLAGGAEEEAMVLLEGVMRPLVVRDYFSALRLFNQLPEPLWRKRPQLLLNRAFLAVILSEPLYGHYVELAGQVLYTSRDPAAEETLWRGEWLALQSGVHLQKGDLQAAADSLAQASAYVAGLDDLAAGFFWYIDSSIRHLHAEQTGCSASALHAIQHFERADFLLGSIAVQRNLARWSMERGESRTANQLFQALLDDLPGDRPETVTEAAVCFLEAAENAYWQNDLAAARTHLQDLLLLTEQLQDPALIYCARIMSVLFAENGAGYELPVRQNYEELEQVSASNEFLKAITLEVRRLVEAGLAEEAWQVAQNLGIDLASAAAYFQHPQAILIPYLQAYMARGKDLPAVTELLKEAAAHYASTGRRFLELQLLVLAAWQKLLIEGERAAMETLSEAGSLAGETGYVGLLRELPRLQGLLDQQRQVGQTNGDLLSEREAEVLMLLAENYTYNEIGAALTISLNTVRSHVRQIYQKLGVQKRSAAIAAARELGLLSMPEGTVFS